MSVRVSASNTRARVHGPHVFCVAVGTRTSTGGVHCGAAVVEADGWLHTQGPLRSNNHFSAVRHGVFVYSLEQAEVLFNYNNPG
jgi:hypothetical protein